MRKLSIVAKSIVPNSWISGQGKEKRLNIDLPNFSKDVIKKFLTKFGIPPVESHFWVKNKNDKGYLEVTKINPSRQWDDEKNHFEYIPGKYDVHIMYSKDGRVYTWYKLDKVLSKKEVGLEDSIGGY